MQINITGHHVDLTDALKQYVTKKLAKLEHHFNHITQIHVTLSVEKKIRQKAEAVVNSAEQQIFAEANEEDMYAAIDEMVDKLERQVVKHKEKLKDHRHGNNHNHDNGIDEADLH